MYKNLEEKNYINGSRDFVCPFQNLQTQLAAMRTCSQGLTSCTDLVFLSDILVFYCLVQKWNHFLNRVRTSENGYDEAAYHEPNDMSDLTGLQV